MAEIVFDERPALDIVDDLIAKEIVSAGLGRKPTRLIVLPDDLSGYQLRSYIMQKGKSEILDDLIVTTFVDLAGRITSRKDIIDSELLRFVVMACFSDLEDSVSTRLKTVISGTEEPEQNTAIEHLLEELDEYTGFVDPATLDKENRTTEITQHLVGLDEVLIDRAETNLEFLRVLVKSCEKHLVELGLDDVYLTRAHLISDAASKIQNAAVTKFLALSQFEELYILGVPIFDNTLLRFLGLLVPQSKSTVIGITREIADRMKDRLQQLLPSESGVLFRNVAIQKKKHLERRYALPDRRREIEFAALKCTELLSKGTTSGDILVVSRLAPDYQPYFEPVFNEFGLPAFMRTREALIFSPAYRFVESVIGLLAKHERGHEISASDIAQPLRLGFPLRKQRRSDGKVFWRAIDDRRFLAIETELEQREKYDGRGKLKTWLKRLKDRAEESTPRRSYFLYAPVIELLDWIEKTAIDEPNADTLIRLLRRFIGVYGVEKDYPALSLVSQKRFEITNEHISSQANRVLAGLYRLVRHQKSMSAARALVRNADTPTSWTDTLKAYRGLVGETTYGRVQRDSDAILFVDAGISHFIDVRHRVILGLNNRQFPVKQPDPFILFPELRESLNKPAKGLFFSSPSTHREIEQYLYVSALGRASDIVLTMNYLDERGHKQNWSVFVDGGETGEVYPHELRVELSHLNSSTTTSNTSVAIASHLGSIRGKKSASLARELTSVVDLTSLPKKWEDEIEAIATSVDALNERVIEGVFSPLLKMGPGGAVDEVFNANRLPSTWEIDMLTYCPAMYYFYIFYHLLPHREWVIGKEKATEPTRYVPAYKEGFMGRTPLPIWRTQFSTRGSKWLEDLLGTDDHTYSESYCQSLVKKVDVLEVSPAEKSAMRHLLSTLSDYDTGFRLKPGGPNTDSEFWRPFIISQKQQGFRIMPYKLRPHERFAFTHFQGRYNVEHCSESSDRYKPFPEEDYPTDMEAAILALRSIKGFEEHCNSISFRDIALEHELCRDCDYATLCGIWGF